MNEYPKAPMPGERKPTWFEILECFAHEADRDVLLGWAYDVKQRNDVEMAGMLGYCFVHWGASKVAEFARDQARAEPDAIANISTEQRKAIVRNILGYDPGSKRSPAPCFLPPPPAVDISDFPDLPDTVMSWKGPVLPSPTAPKPDDPTKPWRNKQELARSRDRIAAYMASDKYLFKDRMPE